MLADAKLAVERIEGVVLELRAERHRADMVLAQLQMHEATLRGIVERLEALAAISGPLACSCPPRAVYAVQQGGVCPECKGRV